MTTKNIKELYAALGPPKKNSDVAPPMAAISALNQPRHVNVIPVRTKLSDI